MSEFECPTCGKVTEQFSWVIDVGHECPRRSPRNKVSTFRRLPSPTTNLNERNHH